MTIIRFESIDDVRQYLGDDIANELSFDELREVLDRDTIIKYGDVFDTNNEADQRELDALTNGALAVVTRHRIARALAGLTNAEIIERINGIGTAEEQFEAFWAIGADVDLGTEVPVLGGEESMVVRRSDWVLADGTPVFTIPENQEARWAAFTGPRRKRPPHRYTLDRAVARAAGDALAERR